MEIIANDYIIYVPYTTIDALKKTVYDILGELDMRLIGGIVLLKQMFTAMN